MRRVLIPTDFSDNAFNALKYACQVFKYERSEFYIMHAYADEVYNQDVLLGQSYLDGLMDEALKTAEKSLKKLKEKITEYAPNPKHEYKTFAVFGSLVDEANDFVNKENIDIVVMGTRGETNDRKISFGSNTLLVLKYVHCPVLAVPEGYVYQKPKKVLFPTNFLVPYKRRELKLLCEITGSFRSTVHMLYIDPIQNLSHRQKDNKKFLVGSLHKPKLLFKTSPEKDKTVAIMDYIEKNGIDVLVIVNSRHSYIEEMLYRSTIDKITLYLKIPFLVMQNIAR